MQDAIDIRRYLNKQADAIVSPPAVGRTLESLFKPRIGDADLCEFFTQLSVMLRARVQLHRALEVLAGQTRNGAMADVIRSLLAEIRRGSPLSKALSQHTAVFDDLMIITAEVGQESGLLGDVLSGLAEYLEKINGLKKKMVQALTYPALVITVAAGAVGFLLTFIVPTFAEMFRSFDMELPWSTQIVLSASEILTGYGMYVLVPLGAIGVFISKSLKSHAMKTRVKEWSLKVPVIGQVLLKNYVARFCRTLGTQLKAQVSLLDALETTRRIISNPALKAEIREMIRVMRRGQDMVGSVRSSRLFPPMVAQMIMVGEESSELDAMLLKVAQHYEKEIDATVERLSTVIEPVIVLMLGMLVGAILIGMYLPMFDLVNVIGT